MKVVVVGPCAAGKTTLVAGLRAAGYEAQVVGQEHSNVPNLWRHNREPDCLIYLDAELLTIVRRGRPNFPPWLLEEQRRRLAKARAAADLYLRSDCLSIEAVRDQVIQFLRHRA